MKLTVIHANSPSWADSGHTLIDLEVTFEEIGKVPFTATYADCAEHGRDLFARAVSGEFGPITPYIAPNVTMEQIIAEVTTATQTRLDAWARTNNYDGILSACTYATSTVAKFAKEGQAAVDLRDATWSMLYAFMDEVQAGTKPMPTRFSDVEPLLPALKWPQ